MKHLVTGGSGFLGNLIARRLLDEGEAVAVLDIWRDPGQPADIEYIECDIRDRAGVARAMRGVDIVHHNVALVPLTKAGDKFREVNVDGSRIAADEAAAAGVQAFVHMSSSAIFGLPVCPVTAATPPRPMEIYGRAKLAGEQAVVAVCDRAKLPLIIIRPRTILGQGRLGIFQILFEWIRQGRTVYTLGSGRAAYQFIHADDLINAYSLVLRAGRPGAYNVGTDRFSTVREALEALIRHAGSASRVRGIPAAPAKALLGALDVLGWSPLAPYHYRMYGKTFYFDVTPLIELGWRARYSNDEMFRESYDWFLAHRDDPAAGDASAHRKPVREGLLKFLKNIS